jgi:hypothetical protein
LEVSFTFFGENVKGKFLPIRSFTFKGIRIKPVEGEPSAHRKQMGESASAASARFPASNSSFCSSYYRDVVLFILPAFQTFLRNLKPFLGLSRFTYTIYTLTGSRAFSGLGCLFCTQILILFAGLFRRRCPFLALSN